MCRGPPVVSGSRLTNRDETDDFIRLLAEALIAGSPSYSPSPTLLTRVKAIQKEPLRQIAHRRTCRVLYLLRGCRGLISFPGKSFYRRARCRARNESDLSRHCERTGSFRIQGNRCGAEILPTGGRTHPGG
jgi:hypothetical protein